MSTSPIRLRRFRAGLVLLSLALWSLTLGLALELWARAKRAVISQDNRALESRRREAALAMEACDTPLWEVQWRRYRKNARLETTVAGVRYVVETNEHGFRTRPVELPRPAGRLRIVCVGGSTTVEGATNDSTYPALLERRLRSRYPDRDIEVLNCGVSGMTAEAELERRNDYLALEPNLILEHNLVNDLNVFIVPNLEHHCDPLTRLMRGSELLRAWSLRPGLDEERLDRKLAHYTLSKLADLHGHCRARGVEVVFASFAAPRPRTDQEALYFEDNMRGAWNFRSLSLEEYRHCVERYNQLLRAWCSACGIGYVPVAENLTGGMELFVDVCHMTPAGIERKAELVAEFLQLPP